MAINNEELAPVETPFIQSLKVNNEEVRYTIDKIPSTYTLYGTSSLACEGYGFVTMVAEADSNNTVRESNETNNTHGGEYEITYCTHTGPVLSAGTNSNIKIWYDLRLLGLPGGNIQTGQDIVTAASAWSNISGNVRFISATGTNAEGILEKATSGDIVIIYGNPPPKGFYTIAETIWGHNSRNESLKVIYCIPGSWNGSIKTLTHEIGHCLGLEHPTEDGDSCIYPTIMRQTWDPSSLNSSTVTVHDMYNLKTYNK